PAGAMQGGIAFSAGAGKPLRKTPLKAFGAQDQRGIRVAFSLDTFFWRRKRKYLGCRAETRRLIIVAIATQKARAFGIRFPSSSQRSPDGMKWNPGMKAINPGFRFASSRLRNWAGNDQNAVIGFASSIIIPVPLAGRAFVAFATALVHKSFISVQPFGTVSYETALLALKH
ncbi:hypothetical protein NP596_19795, partial [Methylomonas sp. WSC-6]|nr:hypothetical protein [Methylomonas sp. WSC-6]